MTSVMIRATVEDLGKWKIGFERAGSLPATLGSKCVRPISEADSPKEVMILAEQEDPGKERQMFQSQELRDVTRRASVSGTPEATFHDEVRTLMAKDRATYEAITDPAPDARRVLLNRTFSQAV